MMSETKITKQGLKLITCDGCGNGNSFGLCTVCADKLESERDKAINLLLLLETSGPDAEIVIGDGITDNVGDVVRAFLDEQRLRIESEVQDGF